ncbi:MAG: hypothetical protein K8W52_13260 [Deltaproteobacteria bacterium]|nr:hypothetical protein [Deltaproteobacteria bacterium]
MTRARLFFVALTCASYARCSSPESPMPTRAPPVSSPTPSPPTAFSAFTTLTGGSVMAFPPGDRLVALHARSATWWEGDAAVTALLPGLAVDGARWSADGRLWVGLGALDLAARAWTPAPALQIWNQRQKPVSAAAGMTDDRVALVLGPPPQLVDRPTVKRTLELVIAARDGKPRTRLALEPGMPPALAASADRVLIGGADTRLVDLDGNPVAGPAGLPESPSRVAFGAGVFAVTGHAGEVTLIRPSDGGVIATWQPAAPAIDAVPIDHGVLAIDRQGTVRVGCVAGAAIRATAEARAGDHGMRIQRVGDRVVISDGSANPVRWATFTNPCR